MNYDLIERYIYAVTKHMDRKQREDVAQELRSLIDDMLMERCGEFAPTEKDIRVVLTELGTPQELYAKYDEDGDKCLIGQPYYSMYKQTLKIVLISAAIGMTVVSILQGILENVDLISAVTGWFGSVVDCSLSSFAFVTIVFAFFQRKGIRLMESFDFDDLPAVPKKKQQISRLDTVIGIGFDVVFLAIFLAAPQFLGMFKSATGEIVPIFNVTAIRASWLVIVAFGALGIIREMVKLLEGQYNRKVLTVTVVADILSAGLAVLWLRKADIFNPAFMQNVLPEVAENGEIIVRLFENFPVFFLSVMLFALAMDMINTIVRSLNK